MPSTHAPYPPEFRAEAVRLARSGEKSVPAIASDLGISSQALREWIRQTEIDDGARDGLSTAEREELRQLRRENRILRQEREILKKAAAFFAKESDAIR
jgi:transposase